MTKPVRKFAHRSSKISVPKMWPILAANIVLSITGYCVILNIVPKFKEMFIKARLSGVDLNKKNKPEMYVVIVK